MYDFAVTKKQISPFFHSRTHSLSLSPSLFLSLTRLFTRSVSISLELRCCGLSFFAGGSVSLYVARFTVCRAFPTPSCPLYNVALLSHSPQSSFLCFSYRVHIRLRGSRGGERVTNGPRDFSLAVCCVVLSVLLLAFVLLSLFSLYIFLIYLSIAFNLTPPSMARPLSCQSHTINILKLSLSLSLPRLVLHHLSSLHTLDSPPPSPRPSHVCPYLLISGSFCRAYFCVSGPPWSLFRRWRDGYKRARVGCG